MVLSELTNYGRLKAYARPIKGIHSSDTLSLYQHIPFVHQFPPLTLLPLPCLHLTYTFLLLAFPRSQPLLRNRNASTCLRPFPSVSRLSLQPCLHPTPLLRSPLTVHEQGFSSVQWSGPLEGVDPMIQGTRVWLQSPTPPCQRHIMGIL